MARKKFIGTILSDLGFITKKEVQKALLKQNTILSHKLPAGKRKPVDLIAGARFLGETASIPMIGEILLDMGAINREQLRLAVKTQNDMIEKFSNLESTALYSVMELGVLVNSSLNLAEVLKAIMQFANQVTNSVASTLMLLEEETGELIFSVPTGDNIDKLTDIRLKPGQGIAGWVAENGEAVIVKDVKKDQRFFIGVDSFSGFKTKSILCVPLKAKNKIIGVLEVINKKSGESFNTEDSLLLTIFASQAAMAIENARLYGELLDTLNEQQQMHHKIAISEKKYRNLFENGSDLICVHDFEGNLLESNLQFKKEYGWQSKDLRGLNIYDIIPKRHQSKFKQYMDRILTKGEDSGYMKGFTRSGKEVILEYRNKLIIDRFDQPEAVQGSARDVTERFMYEKALKESKQRLSTHLKNTPVGAVSWDSELKITEWNPAAEKIFGFTREEAIGKHVVSLIFPDNFVKLDVRLFLGDVIN